MINDQSHPGPVARMLSLEGRSVLVTGGATGLGRAIAAGMVEYGARVMIAGRRAAVLEEAAAAIDGQVDTCVADLTDLADVERLFTTAVETMGEVDVLVNNAGVTVVKPSVDLTADEWSSIMDTNLRAAFFLSAHFARHRVAGPGGGAIVNISSVGALQGGSGVYTAYSASKGGLVSLTRAQASEWARHGVRVNCIAAGAFPTEMSRSAYEDPEIRKKYLRRIPLRRVGDAGEIAPLAVYLASEASAFMTGEVIALDGGQVMQ